MLPFHPLADIFPLIEGAEFIELVASVRASNGPREAIVLFEGAILDGRNRARACEAAQVEPRYELLGEDIDALQFVIDKNIHRRHLNDDQRRMVAARLANMGRGRPTDNPADCGIKVDEAARLMHVDPAGAERARTVISRAEPELRKAVESGHLSVASAAQASMLAPDTQRSIAEQALAGRANAARTAIKQSRRTVREIELSERQRALPTKRYGVIVADPEWRFEVYSRDTGMDRSADNHYPTSITQEIAARPVADIAADDCVLGLWATVPMLPAALSVMAAWGFEYKSHFIWLKDRVGTGYWSRNAHELLLIGTRGKVPAPAPGTQWDSIVPAAVDEHSVKPDDLNYKLFEEFFPHLPKIELNARRARDGWDAWGLEAPTAPAEPISPGPEPASEPEPESSVSVIPETPQQSPLPPEMQGEDDGGGIPDFLRRRPEDEAA